MPTDDAPQGGADQAARLRELMAQFQQELITPVGPASVARPAPPPPPPPRPVAPPIATTINEQDIHAPVVLRRVPVIAVTSGKGGVGKTSITVNMCAAMASRHLRVTLVDADLGCANADVLCGVSPARRLESLFGVAGARRTLSQLAVMTPGGFRLVPGSVGVARVANMPPLERAALLDAMLELELDNDAIFVDTGAGLNEGVLAFVRYADLAVVVVTPEPTSVADAYATIKLLRTPPRSPQLHAAPPLNTRIGVVVNQARDAQEEQETFERVAMTCRRFLRFEPQFLGAVHRTDLIPDCVRARQMLVMAHPRSSTARQIRTIAEHVASAAGLRVPRPIEEAPRPSFWRRMFG